jgi:hypothetical protein
MAALEQGSRKAFCLKLADIVEKLVVVRVCGS